MLLNHKVVNLKNDDDWFLIETTTSNGSKTFQKKFDYVVSTMPLDTLVAYLSPPKHVLNAINQLEFRNTILCFVEIDESNIFEDQWLYLHSDKVLSGRVTNFNNWDNFEYDSSILCFEYWCSQKDEIWLMSDDKAISIVQKDLDNLGFKKPLTIKYFKKINIPKSYPIYAKGYKEHLNILYDFISNIKNLEIIGRYGSFKYNNQDHSILMGLLAARKLMGETGLNILNVNEGDEYHEGFDIPDEYESAD